MAIRDLILGTPREELPEALKRIFVWESLHSRIEDVILERDATRRLAAARA